MSLVFKELGELVDFKGGGTPSRNVEEYWGNSIPWATVKDLNEGITLTETQEFISELGLKNSASNLIAKGTIIIPTRMALGKVVISEIDVAINQDLKAVFVKDKETLDVKYLLRFLESNKENIASMGKGATVKGITLDQLKAIKIPLQPLAEQRRIASILDQADELRQKRQQAIEKLDQLLQAEFMSKFHQKNYPEFNVSDLLENEKSMRTGPFGSQLLHSEFVDEGIHVLGIDNAVQNSFNWAKPRFITEEKYKFLKRYTVKPKDVIITIMGTCGKCAVVPDDIPIAINTKHLCCITLDQTKCNPEFLHSYFLLHPTARNYLESRAKGAIMSGLNMGIIKELPVELPPIKIQNEFSILKQKIILQKTLMIKELSKLNELFTSLQIQAFSGTL